MRNSQSQQQITDGGGEGDDGLGHAQHHVPRPKALLSEILRVVVGVVGGGGGVGGELRLRLRVAGTVEQKARHANGR